jgi:phosphatidylglycerol:prolipoprotein diacylglycerol transferase
MRSAILQWLEYHGIPWGAAIIPTAGVLYSVGLACMVLLFLKRVGVAKLDNRLALTGAAVTMACALLGARLWWFASEWTTGRPNLGDLLGGIGASTWGLYIGGATGALLYFRYRNTSALPFLDIAASCGGLGIFIGRLGCFMSGDDFGIPTSTILGMSYPIGSPAYSAQLARGLIDTTALRSLPSYPLELYLAAAGLAVFWITSYHWNRSPRRAGETLAIFLIADGISRFALEALRDPYAGGSVNGLSISQFSAMLMTIVGLVVLWRSHLPEHGSDPVKA